MNLAKSVRVALAEKGKTQKWLSGQIGISQSGVSIAMTRGSMTIKKVEEIALIFGMKTSELIALGETK